MFLQRLAEAGLKINAEKSFFRRTETEYISFWVSNNVLRPLQSRVESTKSIDVTTKVGDVRRFVGFVNQYRNMWRKREHTLTPFKNYVQRKLSSNGRTQKNAFTEMKKIVGREVLLY